MNNAHNNLLPRISHQTQLKDKNIQQVREAIQILQDNRETVTVRKISGLTGINTVTLYNYEILRPYLRRNKPKNTSKKEKSTPIDNCTCDEPRNTLNNDVSAYVAYLDENHFFHSESRADAKQEMLAEFCDFDERTFNLAIEELLRSGALTRSIAMPGHFLKPAPRPAPVANVTLQESEAPASEFDSSTQAGSSALDQEATEPAVQKPTEPRLRILDQYGELHSHHDDATIDNALKLILATKPGLRLTVYAPVKTAQNVVTIETISK